MIRAAYRGMARVFWALAAVGEQTSRDVGGTGPNRRSAMELCGRSDQLCDVDNQMFAFHK
jgi:hypothetical protein